MRVLGLDLGSRRIGVAVSDPGGVLATPVTVVTRRGDRSAEHRVIAGLVAAHEAERVVVGLPLSLDGSDGSAALAARAEAVEVGHAVGVPVELHDERLTTVTADRLLAEQGLDARARRRVVDQVAAAVLLQSWLEGPGRRTSGQ